MKITFDIFSDAGLAVAVPVVPVVAAAGGGGVWDVVVVAVFFCVWIHLFSNGYDHAFTVALWILEIILCF